MLFRALMLLARTLALALSVTALGLAASGCEGPGEYEDVSYDARFGDATTMDVYVPRGAGPHPAVMFIHGGAWFAGTKAEYTQAAKRLARSGYVAATINYRLVPAGTYPHAVQDCLCALSFLRARAADYDLDPDRIAVVGYSAGGHLAALIGVAADHPAHQPDCASGRTHAPRAVVSGAGPQDLRGKNNKWVRDFLGGSPDEVPERFVSASPIAQVGPGKPPFLFINGAADWLVDIDQARAMRDRLRENGNDANLLEVAGGGHLLNPTTDTGEVVVEEADLTSEGWMALIDFVERKTRARK